MEKGGSATFSLFLLSRARVGQGLGQGQVHGAAGGDGCLVERLGLGGPHGRERRRKEERGGSG